MIIITRDELVALDACAPGLTWFDEHAPSGRVEFADLTALRVWAGLRGGGLYVRWLVTTADKSHRGARLVGVNLADADLVGAKLEHADLTDADLSHSDLTGADLSGADLTGVKLEHANLWRADLTGAKLWHTNLVGADLTRANLEGASLEGARLTGAIRAPSDPPIPGWETYIDDDITRLRRTT